MAVMVFFIGACLGSFYLVLATRLPKNLNVINDRSRCDNCDHTLSWFELIPVFSYIFLKGKCRKCKTKISILCPIIEITTGLLFAFSFIYYKDMYSMIMFDLIASLLIIICITDFSEYLILDSPLVVSLILIIILDLYFYSLKYTLMHLLTGLIMFIIMYSIKIFGDIVFKRESLGGGDIKFSFIIGQILGFRLSLCALILSTFLALPYSYAHLYIKKNNEVPYGPFLAASLLVVYMFASKFIALLNLL